MIPPIGNIYTASIWWYRNTEWIRSYGYGGGYGVGCYVNNWNIIGTLIGDIGKYGGFEYGVYGVICSYIGEVVVGDCSLWNTIHQYIIYHISGVRCDGEALGITSVNIHISTGIDGSSGPGCGGDGVGWFCIIALSGVGSD